MHRLGSTDGCGYAQVQVQLEACHTEAEVTDDDWVLGLLGGKAIEVHVPHSMQL